MKSEPGKGGKRRPLLSLPANVISLGLVSFFTDASSEMIYPLIPIFLTSVLKATPVALGLIEGVAEATASILKWASGLLSDKLRKRKPLVITGYTISSVSRPLIGLAGNWPFVLLIRFADRLGKGIRTSPRDALIADSTPPEKFGTAYSLHRAMDHAGAVAGPVIAFSLLSFANLSLRTVFLLAFVPGILALLTLVFGVRESQAKKSCLQGKTHKGRGKLEKKFFLYLTVVLFFTIGNGSDAFILLKMGEGTRSPAFVPLMWAAFHVLKSAFSLPAGIAADRWSKKGVLCTGWSVFAVSYLIFAFSADYANFLIGLGIYAFYYALTEGVEKAIVAELVPEDARGTAFGAFHLTTGMGSLPASLIFGYLWKLFGAKVAFIASSIIAGLATFVLIFIPLTSWSSACPANGGESGNRSSGG